MKGKVKTVKAAIALITKGNLQRVYGYKCDHHNKIHRYSFGPRVSFIPASSLSYGFDKAREVIDFANKNFDYFNR